MRSAVLRPVCAAIFLLSGSVAVGQPTQKPLAGWVGVFVEVPNYQRTFEKPKVDKKAWRQTAHYEWMGGRAETIHVTFAHDADETKKHQFGDANPQPKELEKLKIGERSAYKYPEGKLVIDLGNDRLMILTAPTWKLFQSDLPVFAKRFPLDACAKALENPPRTEFGRKVESFRELRKGMSLADVRAWVGEAEKDIGSGIHIFTYRLDDGTEVLIGFPDLNRLIYVKHKDAAGKVVDLVK